MRTLKKAIQYQSRSELFTLWYITDTHIGAGACDERLMRRDIEAIKNDPHARWIHGGDMIDCIARKGDFRYQESTLAKWLRGKDDVIGYQRDYFLDLFAPIADKCLAMVEGNHERAALKWYDRNIYWELVAGLAAHAKCDPANLALGVQGFVCLNFQRLIPDNKYSGTSLTLYCHHGYGGGRLPGGDALTLKRVLDDFECDIALLGHRHTGHILSKTMTAAHAPQAKIVRRYAAFVPSYLNAWVEPGKDGRLVDTYNEHIGLPPRSLGATPIVIKPDICAFSIITRSSPDMPLTGLTLAPDAV